MEYKSYAVLVTLMGILLILPLIGVTALGDLTQGITAWVVALAVLVIGILGLVRSFGK